jgi:GntR family transcriptional repressor for pyruvate dehydrogenase complex
MTINQAKTFPYRSSEASLSASISADLRDEILRGQYRPGERLPSERDLAARFNTGRGPVREALKRLEQLGIASIQKGGARVVPIEQCTLDVLGPLLDIEPIPDPRLVDQVLEMVGVLMGVAARDALRKSTDADIEQAKSYVRALMADDVAQEGRHDALRRLTDFFIDVADHLILRLMMNGLRTKFMVRMQSLGIRLRLDGEQFQEIAKELHVALDDRNDQRVAKAMERLNRFFRDGARDALLERQSDAQRIPA